MKQSAGADPGFFLGGVHSSLALLQHQLTTYIYIYIFFAEYQLY